MRAVAPSVLSTWDLLGGAMDASANFPQRICIERDNFAVGIMALQGQLGNAVGRGIAKLWGNHRTVADNCTSASREKSAAPSDLVNPWRCAKLHGPQATPQSWVFKPPKQQHELSDIGPLALAADRSMSLCLSEKDKRLRPLSLSLCMSGEP